MIMEGKFMNYIEFLQKKLSGFSTYDLCVTHANYERLKWRGNDGEQLLGNSYCTAINQILQTKDVDYLTKYANLKRALYEKKRVY